MFDSVGPAELLTLALVGMFVLGPERLPQAAAWVARTVRSIKDYAAGAREHLQSELGADFDEIRKPIDDLRSMRDLDPRRAVRSHLLGPASTDPTPTDPPPTEAAPATPVTAGRGTASAAVEPAPVDDDAT
jgi:sec-independent protein translocase protein TatB